MIRAYKTTSRGRATLHAHTVCLFTEARSSIRGVEVDDDFVRMNHVQVPADEFGDKIGVGPIRVEQRDPVPQHVPPLGQNRKLRLPLLTQLQVLAPCEQA